jgi:HAD superfamily hydrolase (TIGR01509 family)
MYRWGANSAPFAPQRCMRGGARGGWRALPGFIASPRRVLAPHTRHVAIQAVVFDFDGLLMGTEGTMLASWQYEWRQHGLELDVTTFFADHGGDVTAERYALLASAVGPGYDRAASHERRVIFRDGLNAQLGLLPGISEWLDQAPALGLRLAIASSSPRAWVQGLLARTGYRDQFEVIACGDEVARPKPDPAVYRLALDRLGLPGSNAIAVEDAAHGVAAARAADLSCVAIPAAHADVSRFGAADLVLRSAAETSLAEILCALDEQAA